MKYSPHEYQEYATNFILDNPVSAILLECGLGKTLITLTAMFELLLDSFKVRKVLVIAPLRVASNSWPGEINKWDHLKGLNYSLVLGNKKNRVAALKKKCYVFIINRENVDWLVKNHKFDFDMVVVDELSSFKSHKSVRFKSLMKVRPFVNRIVGLTGTPSANGLMDLWAEYKLLDMGKRLGRFIGGYRDAYFLPDKRNQHVIFTYKPKPNAENQIYKVIDDITISMKGKDYLKLPELSMNEVKVDLNEKEQKVINKLKNDLVATIEGKEVTASNAATLSNKLLQMANGCIYEDEGKVVKIHERKLDALEDLVEASNGKPVLIAFWYKHDLEKIKGRFDVVEIKSNESIEKWNKGLIPIGVIHPASAGHGLNLQEGGSTLIWYGLTWSLELYQQTNARLYRQGQKYPVVIHHIMTKGSIDENVMKAIIKKEKIQENLINAVKANLKEVV